MPHRLWAGIIVARQTDQQDGNVMLFPSPARECDTNRIVAGTVITTNHTVKIVRHDVVEARGSAAGPSDSMGHKYLCTTAGRPDWPIPRTE
jgi:hypothetical protein